MQANVLATVWPLNAKFSMPTKLALPVERPWSVVDTSQQLPALKKAKHYNSFSRYYKLSIWIYLDLSGLPSAHLSNVSFAQRAHEGQWGNYRKCSQAHRGWKFQGLRGETLYGMPICVVWKHLNTCFCSALQMPLELSMWLQGYRPSKASESFDMLWRLQHPNCPNFSSYTEILLQYSCITYYIHNYTYHYT
jgi:hypothetical protein